MVVAREVKGGVVVVVWGLATGCDEVGNNPNAPLPLIQYRERPIPEYGGSEARAQKPI